MAHVLEGRVRIGGFELDLKSGELWPIGHLDGESRILLREQPFKVLRLLIEREGEIVTREEIKRQLWPDDTVVDFDHSINATIKMLRRALGDSADHPQYIGTLARRGYRLLVAVEWLDTAQTVRPFRPFAARFLRCDAASAGRWPQLRCCWPPLPDSGGIGPTATPSPCLRMTRSFLLISPTRPRIRCSMTPATSRCTRPWSKRRISIFSRWTRFAGPSSCAAFLRIGRSRPRPRSTSAFERTAKWSSPAPSPMPGTNSGLS